MNSTGNKLELLLAKARLNFLTGRPATADPLIKNGNFSRGDFARMTAALNAEIQRIEKPGATSTTAIETAPRPAAAAPAPAPMENHFQTCNRMIAEGQNDPAKQKAAQDYFFEHRAQILAEEREHNQRVKAEQEAERRRH